MLNIFMKRENTKDPGKFLEGMDIFSSLVAVMLSQVYAYVHTHQDVYIKCVCVCVLISQKRFKKKTTC